jgi:hypothetical protein
LVADISDEEKQAMDGVRVCVSHETLEQLAVRQRVCIAKAIKRKKYVRNR